MTDRVVSLRDRLWIKRKIGDNVFLVDFMPYFDISSLYRNDKHKSVIITACPFLRSALNRFAEYYHYDLLHRRIVDLSNKQTVAVTDLKNINGGLCVRDGHNRRFRYYYLRTMYGDVNIVSFFNYVIEELSSSFDDLSSFNLHVNDFDVLQRWMYKDYSEKHEDVGDPIKFNDLRFTDNPIRDEIVGSMNCQGFKRVYLYNKSSGDVNEYV